MTPNGRSKPGKLPRAEDRFRMEFVRIRGAVNEATGEVEFYIGPDPERYDLLDVKGVKVFRDRIDGMQITQEAAMKMARQSLDMTPVAQPPRITNARAYVASRKDEIGAELDGAERKPTYADSSESFLRSVPEKELGFVIMYADLVGSTKLSEALDPEDNSRIVRTYLREADKTVVQFNGLPLKHNGDAVVAYFPEPSFAVKNDLAIDCALTLLLLVHDGLNPALQSRGLPAIEIRIGIEAGNARIETVGSEEVKEHKELLGFTMNIAAKIQTLAEPGGICVGEISERNMHTRWREILQPIDLPKDWPYQRRVFRVVPGSKRLPRTRS